MATAQQSPHHVRSHTGAKRSGEREREEEEEEEEKKKASCEGGNGMQVPLKKREINEVVDFVN